MQYIKTPVVGIMFIALCSVLLTLTGCDSAEQTPEIAIVDMDQVMQALGQDVAIQQHMQKTSNDINQRLTNRRGELQAQIKTKQDELGESPTEEQQKEFAEFMRNVEQQFQQEVTQARQFSERTQQNMIAQFTERVRPIAMSVAQSMGMNIVMVRTPALLAVSSENDITLAVIDAMRTAGPAGTPGTLSGSGFGQQPQGSPMPGSESPIGQLPQVPASAPASQPAAGSSDGGTMPATLPEGLQ